MSRRPYECFKCRDSGFPNTMVFLAGKDDQGRTIQLEEDGTKHVHKTKDQGNSSPAIATPTSTTTIEQIHNLLASMDGKLDRLLNLAERSKGK